MVLRRQFLRGASALSVAGTALLAGCSEETAEASETPESTPTSTPETSPTGQADARISMVGSNAAGQIYFSPIGLYVDPGTTVVWKAQSGQHSTKAFHPENGDERRIPEEAEPWSSSAISYTEYEYTFEVEGTYDYYCGVHYNHGMIGRVVVGSPGGPATGTDTAYGDLPPADEVVARESITYEEFANE